MGVWPWLRKSFASLITFSLALQKYFFLHSLGQPKWRPEPIVIVYGVLTLIKFSFFTIIFASSLSLPIQQLDREGIIAHISCHCNFSIFISFLVLSLHIFTSKLFELITASLFWGPWTHSFKFFDFLMHPWKALFVRPSIGPSVCQVRLLRQC